jgi:hypothetical protein
MIKSQSTAAVRIALLPRIRGLECCDESPGGEDGSYIGAVFVSFLHATLGSKLACRSQGVRRG